MTTRSELGQEYFKCQIFYHMFMLLLVSYHQYISITCQINGRKVGKNTLYNLVYVNNYRSIIHTFKSMHRSHI